MPPYNQIGVSRNMVILPQGGVDKMRFITKLGYKYRKNNFRGYSEIGILTVRPRTGYHLVDLRPWPFVARFGALRLVRGLLGWMHGRIYAPVLALVSVSLLGLTMIS